MTIEAIRELVAKQDAAQQDAAQAVKTAHGDALKAAKQRRDELSTDTKEGRHAALKSLVEDASAKVFATRGAREQAGLYVGQFASARADEHGVPPSASRDGKFLIQTAIEGTAGGYSPEQRIKIYAALIMAAIGKCETGLISFPVDWSASIRESNLIEMARALDAKALEKLESEQADKAAELAEVNRLVAALEQATPSLYRVNGSAEALKTTIRNSGGPVGIDGVKIVGFGSTVLDAESYEHVREHRMFNAFLEKGQFVIESQSALVEEL